MSFQSSTVKGLVTTGNVGLTLKGKDASGSEIGFAQKKLTFTEPGLYICTGILSGEFESGTTVINNALEYSFWQNGVSTQLVKIVAVAANDDKTYSAAVTLMVKVDTAGAYLQGALDSSFQGMILGQFAIEATKLC